MEPQVIGKPTDGWTKTAIAILEVEKGNKRLVRYRYDPATTSSSASSATALAAASSALRPHHPHITSFIKDETIHSSSN